MDGALKSKRMYPSYTTSQLESFVADIKANETGSDACMRVIAMQDEIDRRKAGLAPVTAIPQFQQETRITYKPLNTTGFEPPCMPIQVKLDGKVVGLIRQTSTGYAYKPKGAGSKWGETFSTIDAVKRSLEED